MTAPTHYATRFVFDDGSSGASVWEPSTEPCPWCHAVGGVYESTAGNYAVCLTCESGWSEVPRPSKPATNDVLRQTLEQLARARRA